MARNCARLPASPNCAILAQGDNNPHPAAHVGSTRGRQPSFSETRTQQALPEANRDFHDLRLHRWDSVDTPPHARSPGGGTGEKRFWALSTLRGLTLRPLFLGLGLHPLGAHTLPSRNSTKNWPKSKVAELEIGRSRRATTTPDFRLTTRMVDLCVCVALVTLLHQKHFRRRWAVAICGGMERSSLSPICNCNFDGN